jgi:hypothetical protein
LGAGGGGNGGGDCVSATGFVRPTSGLANTGGGGGGAGGGSLSSPNFTINGAAGGSGIVIIRYPAYQVPAASTTGSPEMYIAGPWRVYKFVASGTITF